MPRSRQVHVRVGRASQAWSSNRALWVYLLTLIAFTIVMVITFDYFELHSPAYSPDRMTPRLPTETTPVADQSTTPLGFPYPQLSNVRRLLPDVLADKQMKVFQLRQAYTSAVVSLLRQANMNGDSTSPSKDLTSAIHALLHEAIGLLTSGNGLLHCRLDESLLSAWHAATTTAADDDGRASATQAAARDKSSVSSRKYVLAANFQNSAAVLPNFIVQTLRLSLVLPAGQFAVSVYESGSSDTSRMWITLLHYLLLPLDVPHNITTAGRLSPRLGLSRIELLAQLRNALVEPWVDMKQQQQLQHHHQHTRQQHRLLEHAQQPVVRRLMRFANKVAAAGRKKSMDNQQSTSSPTKAAAAAGAAVLSAGTGAFTPDHFIFVNDVFFCAEDVLRLMMHDADMACGMDFYTAPWQHNTAAAAAAADSNDDSAQDQVQQRKSRRYSAAAAAANLVIADDDGDDDVWNPDLHQVVQQDAAAAAAAEVNIGAAPGASSTAAAGGGLRFYDKWVSRDISGHRLVNKPPFIKQHKLSAQQLAAGLPVPMRCCWNGLVVLTAAAMIKSGIRFRTHQAGECAGSECSLLCEDYQRLGLSHVVMDPGVRLAYEFEQVDMLKGTAAAAAGGVNSLESSSSRDPSAVEGLGARLPWSDVAPRSEQLAAEAQQRQDEMQAACRLQHEKQQGLDHWIVTIGNCSMQMECCDLQPGRSYVDFKRDCHMVDIMAVNFTAQELRAATAAAAAA